MRYNMRTSVHVYNSADIHGRPFYSLFKRKTQTVNRAASRNTAKPTSWVFDREIQKMWQIKLPLCKRARTLESLSFCQYARNKTNDDLYPTYVQRLCPKGFGQLSRSTTDYGRNKHNQSHLIGSERIFVGERLWNSKWKPPP